MKKFINFIIVVFMFCALCVPVFAYGDTPTEVTPTKRSDGNDEISITSPGNYIITKDCEIYNLRAMYCELTIAEDVKVTVTENFNDYSGILNIEHGAVLKYCGKSNCDIGGTMNVFGTFIVDTTTFSNALGTINVYGTVDLSECANGSNSPGATINIYSNGSFIESKQFINGGTIDQEGSCYHDFDDNHVCTKCREADCTLGLADHTWDANHECTKCHKIDCALGLADHTWDANTGKCSFCGCVCPHEVSTCVVCGKEFHSSETDAIGSVLSDGSLAIITAFAGIVVGMIVMFFIMNKKKSTFVSSTSNKDEK